MKVELKPGKYVVAASGGVDSMSLLDILVHKPDLELVVAHFNHGIRPDAAEDEELVREVAKDYGLVFEAGRGKLGSGASEEAARNARYKFLRSVQAKYGADAIITAHHQDDLLETAAINLIRGTGRKGLSAIMTNPLVVRPLINYPKSDLIKYARKHKLTWREDSTNLDERYLRNYIRLYVIPAMDSRQRKALLKTIGEMASRNIEIDEQVDTLSRQLIKDNKIDRRMFTSLPSVVAGELVAHWLRKAGFSQFDRKKIESLSLAIKTARPGTIQPIASGLIVHVDKRVVHFETKVIGT